MMDNAPGHLMDELVEKLKFIPPNMTLLIEPIDSQVISNFKKFYTKSLFQRYFEVISDTETSWNHI